jgi:hypothetical protein
MTDLAPVTAKLAQNAILIAGRYCGEIEFLS